MNAVKMPRLIIAGAVFVLFALALHSARQYGVLGMLHDLTVAVGAGLMCVAVVAGLIYANYERYLPGPEPPHCHGTP